MTWLFVLKGMCNKIPEFDDMGVSGVLSDRITVPAADAKTLI